jgi:hypothetical protein
MEELFQLIVALFIVSFPILNLFARRRQARRAQKQREKVAREAEATGAQGSAGRGASPPRPDRERGYDREPERRDPDREGRAGRRRRRAAGVTDVSTSEPRRKGRLARWAEQLEARARQTAGEREEWPSARQGETEGGGAPGRGGAASRGRPAGQPADVTRQYEIGRGPGERGTTREMAGAEARERIAGLPQLQQAVVWAEILGRPKALRRSPDPWDDDAGP